MTFSKRLRFVIRSQSNPTQLWASFRDSEDAILFHRHMMDFSKNWEVFDTENLARIPTPSRLPGVMIIRVNTYQELEPLETVANNLGLAYRYEVPTAKS